MRKRSTAGLAVALFSLLSPTVHAENIEALSEITISGSVDDASTDASLGASGRGEKALAPQRATTSDSAHLLQDVPGVSLSGAGGISSLPAIHGLSDDRIRVQVDGMDLTASCPNHMNSPLSHIDPTKITKVTVYAGITPVSVGGDSIGGSIQVTSAPPAFATPDEKILTSAEAGTFYRSNGNGTGYNLGATVAGQWLHLSYTESGSKSDNYVAGRGFKPAAPGRENGPVIPGDEVGSSSYHGSTNRELGLALRHDGHLLQLNVSRQKVGFEGFPNQRMDMTDNDNTLFNLRYTGQYPWGELQAQASRQDTRHRMDMGPDRYSYGTGMPMLTKGITNSLQLRGNVIASDRDTLRLGAEYQYYRLNDWWPPVGGSMGPNTFWNIDYGQRERIDTFVEWEAGWTPEWTSLVGVRSDIVRTNAGPAQGYDNGMAGLWGDDAAAFNVRDREQSDVNWDLAALARFTPDAGQTYEAGFARKSRSPNLYQRYPWSTNPMAALMNNLAGDGNGYLGNVGLTPEVANTVSITGDWHADGTKRWGVKATGYYTYIEDYIDVKRCDVGQCSEGNTTATTGFVILQYVNQAAQLYGLDLSAHRILAETGGFGSFTITGLMNYVRGENVSTGGHLYNIMPLNGKLTLEQGWGALTTTAELQMVAAKTDVSRVRNEIRTSGYSLVNLRSSYEWKYARLDVGIDNLFDRYYAPPLGGAYVGQGPSMTSNGIPWGIPVPGRGRSVNVALNLHF